MTFFKRFIEWLVEDGPINPGPGFVTGQPLEPRGTHGSRKAAKPKPPEKEAEAPFEAAGLSSPMAVLRYEAPPPAAVPMTVLQLRASKELHNAEEEAHAENTRRDSKKRGEEAMRLAAPRIRKAEADTKKRRAEAEAAKKRAEAQRKKDEEDAARILSLLEEILREQKKKASA